MIEAIQDVLKRLIHDKHSCRSHCLDLAQRLAVAQQRKVDIPNQLQSSMMKVLHEIREQPLYRSWVLGSKHKSSLAHFSYKVQCLIDQERQRSQDETESDDEEEVPTPAANPPDAALSHLSSEFESMLQRALQQHTGDNPLNDASKRLVLILLRLRVRLFQIHADQVATKRIADALESYVQALRYRRRAMQEQTYRQRIGGAGDETILEQIQTIEVEPARRRFVATLNQSAALQHRDIIDSTFALALPDAHDIAAIYRAHNPIAPIELIMNNWMEARRAGAVFLLEPKYCLTFEDMHRMIDASLAFIPRHNQLNELYRYVSEELPEEISHRIADPTAPQAMDIFQAASEQSAVSHHSDRGTILRKSLELAVNPSSTTLNNNK